MRTMHLDEVPSVVSDCYKTVNRHCVGSKLIGSSYVNLLYSYLTNL